MASANEAQVNPTTIQEGAAAPALPLAAQQKRKRKHILTLVMLSIGLT